MGMAILDPRVLAQAQAFNPELLEFVNHCTTTSTVLEVGVGLTARAASDIVAHRDGEDAICGTEDDDPFDTVQELDDVPYVGTAALDALRAYAETWQPPHPAPALRGWASMVFAGLMLGTSLLMIARRASTVPHEPTGA